MFDVHKTTAAAYSVTVDGDDFRYSGVNRACLELVGLTRRFYPGLDPKACFNGPIADEILGRYRACRDSSQAVTYVSEARSPNGIRRWRTTLFPMTDDAGRVVSIVGVCVDARQESASTDQQVGTRDGRLALAMGEIDGGFWVYEMATGVFETSTPLAEYIAGPGHTSLNLAEYASYVHAEDLNFRGLFIPANDRSTTDYRVVTYDGRTRWLQCRRRIVRDQTGAILRVVGLVVDITEQKAALRVLESEASTDPLTSLKNRRAFDRAAAEAFAKARDTGETIGVLLIDLDEFKPINDRYGHRAGDEILRKVARRLARNISGRSTLARLGGDEFGVLLHEATLASGDALARKLSGRFEKPLELDEHAIFVGVSTGLAVSTPTDTSFEFLLERADRNLYAAKKKNRLLTA